MGDTAAGAGAAGAELPELLELLLELLEPESESVSGSGGCAGSLAATICTGEKEVKVAVTVPSPADAASFSGSALPSAQWNTATLELAVTPGTLKVREMLSPAFRSTGSPFSVRDYTYIYLAYSVPLSTPRALSAVSAATASPVPAAITTSG